ncbi:MAG: S8/S53 family peptidase [Firmicutes bacterium]|nr:S8/S53 family peptidase [Bacillota bacterium]
MTWNKDVYEKHNVLKWHELEYKGQEVNVVWLDFFKEDENHGRRMKAIINEVAPLANVIELQSDEDSSIDYIVANKDKIDIINCSFGAKLPFYFLTQLKDLGIPIIAASGNEHQKDRINMPASFNFTIAIGEYMDSFKKVVDRSNKGEKLDAVNESFFFFWNDEETFSTNGTSASTAFTTSMIALLLSWAKKQGLKLNNEQVRNFIHENSLDLYEEGRDNTSGYGLFILPEKLPSKEEFVVEDTKNNEVSEWAKEAQAWVKENEISDGTRPKDPITREEIWTMLHRINNEKK